MNRPRVSLLRHDNYDPDAVLYATRRLLAPLGGMEAFIPSGAKVVLKPNLVLGKSPDKAVNTHPQIVRAAALLAFEAGAAKVSIGDSPGFGSARAAAAIAGIADVADELGLEIVEFSPVEHVSRDRPFVKLELARELLEADVVVNLPKLKTHGQMVLTMAVKNLFGAVPGTRKLHWHHRAGRDKASFARIINAIARAVGPALTILDAVVAMDGQGPTSGTPRQTNFLAAGGDPWAVDAAMMDILGFDRLDLPTLETAALDGHDLWTRTEISGEQPETLRPEAWSLPAPTTARMHGRFIEAHFPRISRWLMKRFPPPPRPNAKCERCGHCVEICPARAMRMHTGQGVVIDSARCIRCYCCHELCPYGGMTMRGPGMVRHIFSFFDRFAK